MTANPLRMAQARRSQALVFVLLFGFPCWAAQDLQREYSELPAKTSEFCSVCGTPLTEEDVALIVRGRRVPLCRSEIDTFLKNQEKYFSSKQPKSALFQEELSAPPGTAQGGISRGWFLFGLLVLSSLVFGGLSGYRAVSRGLSPLAHFFLGFFLNILGFLYVLSRPAAPDHQQVPKGLVKVPTTARPQPCPACANLNHPSAQRCSACGQALQPSQQSEVARV